MQAELLKLIDDFEVVSFDVFDTLLLRPYLKPADLFAKIGGETFRGERIAAERKAREIARAAGREEVSFDEIYELLPRWPDMKQRELDEERRCLTANPEMLEVWKRAGELGKKRVIASDMYLPRQFLEDVLREKGIDGWDDIYLSSERNATKHSGSLFEVLAREVGAAPAKVLHVGDNIRSDVLMPEKCKIGGWYYPKLSDRFVDANPYAKAFLAIEESSAKRSNFLGTIICVEHILSCKMQIANEFDSLAVIFGGVVLHAYARWIVKSARERGVTRLLFVARDGYTVKRIVESLAPEIQTDYIYAPRPIAIFAREGKQIPEDYVEYIQSLDVDPLHTGIVDGNTEAYSSQRLLEATLGEKIFGFYFMSKGEFECSHAFIRNVRNVETCLYMLLEMFYSAPFPPAAWVKDGVPQYFPADVPYEKIRAEGYQRVSDIEVAAADLYNRLGIEVTADLVHEWLYDFIYDMPLRHRIILSHFKNPVDINHTEYHSIVFPQRAKTRSVAMMGIPLFTIRYRINGMVSERLAMLFNRWRVLTRRTRMAWGDSI